MKRLLLLLVFLIPSAVLAQTKVSGIVSLTASASDAGCGIKSVQWYLGTTAIGPAQTVAPYTYNWDSKTVTNGPYEIRVIASDKSGGPKPAAGMECNGSMPNNSTPMAPGSIRSIIVDNVPIDTTPPTVTITTPVAGAVVDGKIDIEVAATDPQGISRIDLYLSGNLKSSSFDSETLSYNWNTNPYKGETVIIRALAWDGSGAGPGNHQINVTVDKNGKPDK